MYVRVLTNANGRGLHKCSESITLFKLLNKYFLLFYLFSIYFYYLLTGFINSNKNVKNVKLPFLFWNSRVRYTPPKNNDNNHLGLYDVS